MPTQTLPFTLTVEPFLGFAPPAACREGIEANLKILAQHAQLVFASVSDDAETE